jgi:hypothetical protein
MDPNATLKAIQDAHADQDWPTTLRLADELANWLNLGGFPPDGMTRGEADELAANYAYTAREHLREMWRDFSKEWRKTAPKLDGAEKLANIRRLRRYRRELLDLILLGRDNPDIDYMRRQVREFSRRIGIRIVQFIRMPNVQGN